MSSPIPPGDRKNSAIRVSAIRVSVALFYVCTSLHTTLLMRRKRFSFNINVFLYMHLVYDYPSIYNKLYLIHSIYVYIDTHIYTDLKMSTCCHTNTHNTHTYTLSDIHKHTHTLSYIHKHTYTLSDTHKHTNTCAKYRKDRESMWLGRLRARTLFPNDMSILESLGFFLIYYPPPIPQGSFFVRSGSKYNLSQKKFMKIIWRLNWTS